MNDNPLHPGHPEPPLGIADSAVEEVPQTAPEQDVVEYATADHGVGQRLSETVQTVLISLIMAFTFRAYFVEAFMIPTGSMANGLLGDHFTHVCPACGFEYDVSLSGSSARLDDILCPNCHLREAEEDLQISRKSGDRLLVHKWPHELGGWFPLRHWDVIVFRDPADPEQNYIKRLIGLPGDSVEIIDGDVFVNGEISRKTDAAQSALWFPVFDQDHYPAAGTPAAEFARWIPRESEALEAGWSGLESRQIEYAGLGAGERAIRFDETADREYFCDVYGYNRGSTGTRVGDLRLSADLEWCAGAGPFTLEIVRDDARYLARLWGDGRVEVWRESEEGRAQPERLAAIRVGRLNNARAWPVAFAYVDQRLELRIDGKVVFQSSAAPIRRSRDEARADGRIRFATVGFSAEDARLALRNVRIDRDVFYTEPRGRSERAARGRPFELKENEYFVLGDNSPDSHDGREWATVSRFLPADYRPGTVRSDQIVGRAAFVYLPGVLPIGMGSRGFIPDLGRVRFVR